MPRVVPVHGQVSGSSGQFPGFAHVYSQVPLSPSGPLLPPPNFLSVPTFDMPGLPCYQTGWVDKLHWNVFRRQMDANEVLLWDLTELPYLVTHMLCNMLVDFCLILFTTSFFILTTPAGCLISWAHTVTRSRPATPFLSSVKTPTATQRTWTVYKPGTNASDNVFYSVDQGWHCFSAKWGVKLQCFECFSIHSAHLHAYIYLYIHAFMHIFSFYSPLIKKSWTPQ